MQHIGFSPKRYKALLPAALLIAALLAACASTNTQPTPADTQVGLETLVAEAVITAKASTPNFPTGMPTGLAAQTSTPTITLIPTATQEGAPPESSNPQSDNPPDVSAGEGGEQQATPTVFITLTPPGMPTRSPSDLALTFGDPDWSDGFDTDENWGTYQTNYSQVEISGGQLRFTLFETGGGPTWALSWPTVTNFYMEATAQTPQQCSGKDAYGLVFRADTADQGYRLEIFCDGIYRLVAFSPSGIQVLAGGTHEAINAGPNQINRLAVWVENKVIVIHINGVAITGFEDNTFRAAGRFGFTITAEETEPFTVLFDDLAFWTFE